MCQYLCVGQQFFSSLRVLVPDEVFTQQQQLFVYVIINWQVPSIHNSHIHTALREDTTRNSHFSAVELVAQRQARHLNQKADEEPAPFSPGENGSQAPAPPFRSRQGAAALQQDGVYLDGVKEERSMHGLSDDLHPSEGEGQVRQTSAHPGTGQCFLRMQKCKCHQGTMRDEKETVVSE